MDLTNLKVLVVDDSTIMVKIITNVLNNLGVKRENMITGQDGKEALEKFKQNQVDIIFTDWNMPIMNGLELIKQIRIINKDIKIIMITTEAEKTSIISALKAGANNYVIKPFNADTLKTKLIDILSH